MFDRRSKLTQVNQAAASAGFITELDVLAQGTFPVEVGRRSRLRKRVPLQAQVNPKTGEVRFFVDPDSVDDLR